MVADTASRDGTREAARQAGARVLAVDPAAFDHGLTRNLAAAALPEDLDVLVFLVQDAVPQGETFLGTLGTAALRPGVGGATARQVPPAGCTRATVASVTASPFAAAEPRRIGPLDEVARTGLTPAQWRARVCLDDIACALRADLFRRMGGYRAARHGEDALMAYDLLSAGWALEHEPGAVVEHGHEYTVDDVGLRYEADAVFFRERFGFASRPSWLSVAKGVLAAARRDRALARLHPERPGTIDGRPLSALRRAQVWAQYRGSRGPLGSLPERRAVPTPADLGVPLAGESIR